MIFSERAHSSSASVDWIRGCTMTLIAGVVQLVLLPARHGFVGADDGDGDDWHVFLGGDAKTRPF